MHWTDDDGFQKQTVFIPKYNTTLSVNPNPNTGKFEVSLKTNFKGNAQLNILDVNGQVVYTKDINIENNRSQFNVDLNISNGTYYYQLIQGSVISGTGKFIINK